MSLTRYNFFRLVAFFAWAFIIVPPPVNAAVNAVIGGVGGINNGTLLGGDGTGTGQITLNTVDLSLMNQARDLTGAILPNGSDVTSGQEIYFVLYVDNFTAASASPIRITDLINESQFTYVLNSLETTWVPSGSNDAAIWAGPWSVLTDLLGGPDDIASMTDSGSPGGPDRLTVGDVSGQLNLLLDIPASSLRAIRFRVTVN